MEQLPVILTFNEAKELMGVTENILRRMVESRIIPFYRILGNIRFDQRDVLDFIEKNRASDGSINTYIAPHKSHKKEIGHKLGL